MQSRLTATRNRGYWVFSSLTRNRVSQQRSHVGASTSTLEDVSCVGLDGTPLLEEGDRGEEEEEEAYYKEHKPSPLSMIEVADSRKPITRATDGTAREYESGEYVVVWKEEQLDTAEEALMRAVRIWKEAAMRGDPDSPQSRVLRALRGE